MADTQTIERATYTVEEAAAVLGIGRALAYDMVRQGKIPSLRLGDRYLVPRAGIEKILDAPATPGR